jgi:hypothetical protein
MSAPERRAPARARRREAQLGSADEFHAAAQPLGAEIETWTVMYAPPLQPRVFVDKTQIPFVQDSDARRS